MTGERPKAEPDFNEDVSEMEAAVVSALNELTRVKAYTVKPDELRDFKAAQYALRNLSPDHGNKDVQRVFDE